MTNIPRLRFKEFNQEWQVRPLNNFARKITKKNVDFKVKNVISNSALYGLISQRDYFDKDIANIENIDNYYIIKDGDFVYNPRISRESPYGPVNIYKQSDLGVVSPLYLCFRVSGISNDFLAYFFKTSFWHRHIYTFGDSGARHDRVSIKDSDFFKLPISLPSLREQLKIASFFTLLDQKIEKQQEKIEQLEQFRKGMLQKLFSREIRFKDENGQEFPDWTSATLEELGSFVRNYSFSRSVEGEGEYQHIHYGDIHSKFSGIITSQTELPSLSIDTEATYTFLENGDVVFADASEDTSDLGKSVVLLEVNKRKILGGLHTHCFRPNKRLNPLFLHYYTLTDEYKKFIRINANGVSVFGLSKPALASLEVPLPDIREQQRISDFLYKLSRKIELLKLKKIELELMKKSFLSQMFV